MVLVAYKPSNNISILQTKFSDREGHEARRVGLEAMPLDQHIEGSHGERQARLKIGPAPMHHLLHMADERQHREHRLHQHPVLPLPALTQFQGAGIPLRGMEAGVAQDNHPVWSKNSCGLALVVFQEPAESFSTVNRAWTSFICP